MKIQNWSDVEFDKVTPRDEWAALRIFNIYPEKLAIDVFDYVIVTVSQYLTYSRLVKDFLLIA